MTHANLPAPPPPPLTAPYGCRSRGGALVLDGTLKHDFYSSDSSTVNMRSMLLFKVCVCVCVCVCVGICFLCVRVYVCESACMHA